MTSNIMLIRKQSSSPFRTVTDKDETNRLTSELGGGKGSYRVVKSVLKNPLMAPAIKAIGAINKFHDSLTSRWNDAGFFLIKAHNYERYTEGMDSLIGQARDIIHDLSHNWDRVMEAEREFLGEKRKPFIASDYPTAEGFRDSFSYTYAFQSLPNMEGVEINSFTLSALREALDRRNQEALRQTTNELNAEMVQLLEHMVNTLADPDKIFRNSLVDNVRTLLEQREARDMCSDPVLKERFDSIASMIAGVSADDLRNNKRLRSELAREAEEKVQAITRQSAGRAFLK